MATISSIISLTDDISGKLATIQGNVDSLVGSMKNVNGVKWDKFISQAEAAGKKMQTIGKQMSAAITAPLLLLGKKMYGSAVDYEAAEVGMSKTVEGTTEQYEHLHELAKVISETTPTGYVEALGIMQMGGNLGVKVDDMETFTKSYTALVSATDQHVSGETGAQDVANFLNILEGGVGNIEQFGSSLVYLGNNFNATEDQILGMGTRMAAAGKLANFSTPQVLGMATAFTAVGINAEAGGSAASKLIKQMQLAAEVGSKAQKQLSGTYGNATDFSYFISDKENLLGVAQEFGVTTKQIQSMADSWLSLEQFSQVSGKTADQFTKDWGTNPAQGMFDFFDGLSKIDEAGMESTLSMLDKMGLTEIRESNLIAAMASNPELFASAVEGAIKAYNENAAMWEEFNKVMGTQESQNAMLQNKLDNSMADLGENVVQAVQPALEKVNELLTAFNSLSEVDQDKIVDLMGALIIAGPSLIALGTLTRSIGSIAKGIQAISKCTAAKAVLEKVGSFLSTPVGAAMGVAAAVGLIAGALSSIPTKAEEVAAALQDIPITINQEQYDAAMVQIDALQAKIAELKADPGAMENLANTSQAVQIGLRTNGMFNDALVYEAAMFEDQYSQVAGEYAVKMADITQKIVDNKDDPIMGAYWKEQYELADSESKAASAKIKQAYSERISDLYNGMVKQMPEYAKQMETAAKQYDLMGTLMNASNFSWDDPNYDKWTAAQQEAFDTQKNADWAGMMKGMYKQAFDLGYLDKSGFSLDQIFDQVDAGSINNAGWMLDFQTSVLGGLQESVQAISDNPEAYTWLQTILDNPALTENLDLTQLTGAMDGIFKTDDFRKAMEQATEAGDPNSFGAYLMQGLSDGITTNTGLATESAGAAGTSTVEALGASLGVNSPSVIAMDQGMNVDAGLALGITMGIPTATMAIMSLGAAVISALSQVCNQAVATASGIMSFGAGASIGANMASGLASGILSQMGSVVAAARRVAAAASAAMRVSLKIHSPSKVTEEYGEFFSNGFARGILNDIGNVEQAVIRVSEASKASLQDSVWSAVNEYNGLEFASMQDPDNNEIKISETDLKKVRQLAEREIINQFTTAELHVEYTNNNNIKSDLDVDDLFDQFGDRLAERIEFVAGGVYQ